MYRLLLFLLLSCSVRISAQNQSVEIALWENGAPGFESLKDQPAQAKDWWIKNIHNPTLTVFEPENNHSKVAVIIFPGGGHRELVFNAEGRDPGVYLASLGITAFALKYRLAREEGSPYSLPDHPRQDAYRAIRLVRQQADRWDIDPDKVGVMGFSAGGEVATMVAYGDGNGNSASDDPVERQNGKPDFQILIYPGPNFIPEAISKNDPPGFIVTAFDDPCCSTPSIKLLQLYHQAGVPMEAHVYSKGGHAFNMGYRSELVTISGWPDRLKDWLTDSGLIEKR